MNRSSIALVLVAQLVSAFVVQAQEIATPSAVQYVWHEQERIQFVCIDPCTWQGREYDDHSTPLEAMLLPELDTDQWCETALSWGAREILFVAKHTGGFCWWRTETTEYCVRNIGWRNGEGDLLVELATSCAKYGLSLGIYVYPGDETWGAGIGSGGRTRDPAKQEAYNEVFRQQLRETLDIAAEHTRVVEVWFDGSCVIEVGDVLREHAPEAVVFQGPHATIRWVGNERGRLARGKAWSSISAADRATGLATAAHSDLAGESWTPLEVNTTLYDHAWFWGPGKEAKRKSLDELMYVYYQSAGQGAVMLLNSTPDTRGLIPDGDVRRYGELGAEIERRFGTPLAQASGRGRALELDFGGPTLVNHVVTMEDYLHGERIRSYLVEGWDGARWAKLAEGTSVGRKRIDVFDDAVVTKVRLRVTEAAAEPLVLDFAAHHVTGFRPAPNEPVRSAWAQCGSWSMGDFEGGVFELEIDLTPHVTEAGQWRVRFEPTSLGSQISIHDEVLLQQGQASTPGILTRVEGELFTYHVNRTAVITEDADIRLRVTLLGSHCDGLVLVRSADSSAWREVPEPERAIDGPALLQGAMVGEVTATTAILQTRLTAASVDDNGDVPGVAGIARFEIGEVELLLADGSPTEWRTAEAAGDFIVKVAVNGLRPNTRHWYRVAFGSDEEHVSYGGLGSFETLAGAEIAEPTRFVVVTGMNYDKFHFHSEGDGKRAYQGSDRHLGYPALKAILELEPDFLVGTGDNVYYDHPKKGRATTEVTMRKKWHEQLVQPRFVDLFAKVPTYWEKDDHDHRFNDCDRSGEKLPSSDLGIRLFREQVPVVDPEDPDAVTYRTFRVSRDLQIWLLEGRDYRSPNASPDDPDKTIWGAAQREWLQTTLLASDATFKIVISPTPLVGPDDRYKKDNHTNLGGFRHEGRAFLTWAADAGLLERGLYFVCGDRHWQYHSIDPTGFEEFSTGALVDANSRLGPKPGAEKSTDREALVRQPYTSREPSGGFLHVVIEPGEGESPPHARFELRDEHGTLLYSADKGWAPK